MKRELTADEVVYKFEVEDRELGEDIRDIPEYDEVYKKIKMALEIDKEGYNVYLIDNFSKDKLQKIIGFIKQNLQCKERPMDICYVLEEDEKYPKIIFVPAAKGKKLKEKLEEIQNVYLECIYEFYNGSSNKQKEVIVEELHKKRADLISKLVKDAKEKGFTMKTTQNGFTFMPIKDNTLMNEEDYSKLEVENKDEMLNKVSSLKANAKNILDKLKEIESIGIEKIRILLDEYFITKMEDIKKQYLILFQESNECIEFLDKVCYNIENEVKEAYSINYEDDEEQINSIIYKYLVNVLVDNSEVNTAPVIFEEDPNVNNLLGSIEYENKNGSYVTDINLIKPGSLLRANGGCLIIRASSLLNNASAYYYLKKSIISGKVDLNYNRGYLELLSLSGLKPEPVKFNEKIILIGDYNIYDLLYNYDEDFKKIFKIRAEYNAVLDINKETKKGLLSKIYKICESNNLFNVNYEGIRELAKFLSRKAENRSKFYMDENELNRLLVICNNKVKNDNRSNIEGEDIANTVSCEELIEKQIDESYKENKVFINIKDKLIGKVNGLSVIDTGYFSFGKPIRITCCCYKGVGNIIDIQRESNLSGNIHNKAIGTLRGYINNLIGGYEKIPVDFQLSFEQLYGTIDGDSASVAEAVCIISSLSKIGIKQNIAVTGSINQFGEVQPVGGINDKIEGFFKVCKLVDTIKGKGVLIPEANLDNLVLNKEVEQEVKNGNFHIYSMNYVKDAVEILMGEEKIEYGEIINKLNRELKKYTRVYRRKK